MRANRQRFTATIEVVENPIPYSSLDPGDLFVESCLTDFTGEGGSIFPGLAIWEKQEDGTCYEFQYKFQGPGHREFAEDATVFKVLWRGVTGRA
jgi:hypothetical protein